MAEKILSAHSDSEARAGDLVIAELDYVMAGDAKGPKAVDIFREAGFEFRMDPKKQISSSIISCPPRTFCGRTTTRS